MNEFSIFDVCYADFSDLGKLFMIAQMKLGLDEMDTINDLVKDAQHVGPDYFDSAQEQDNESSYFVAGPVQEHLILAAEQKLGVAFPEEYRKFIASHGAMLGNGYELFGLTPDADDKTGFFRDIVRETMQSPANASASSSPRYIAISADGMGTDFLIDTQASLELRIVANGPGVDCVAIANTLDEFWQNMMLDTYASRLNALAFNG
ncbi:MULTISPECIES: SMI1/KNR4 family protein [Rhodobacterales]|uniref:SMI1/KNR4 family protein n=1 Tax=Rhodobacterales TaxID=204455 RepID=UPI0015F007BB|nr:MULTISPECIES: SMI1/KNR4 family protein [Rhodobacterales]MDO6592157.1 SMI1/KNR4 family protein [Yoonia sp. 1_MG-2023]